MQIWLSYTAWYILEQQPLTYLDLFFYRSLGLYTSHMKETSNLQTQR